MIEFPTSHIGVNRPILDSVNHVSDNLLRGVIVFGISVLCIFVTNVSHAKEVTLSWVDNSDDEEGFNVERSSNGGIFLKIGETVTNVFEYLDTTVQLDVEYEYRVNAFNEYGVSGYTNIVVSYEENSAPTITAILDASIDENSFVDLIEFTIGDAHTSDADLSIALTSSNEDLIAASDIVNAGSSSLRSLSFQPKLNASGETVITVTVSDGSLETSEAFSVVVVAYVSPSISTVEAVSPETDQIHSGEGFSVGLDISDTDLVEKVVYYVDEELYEEVVEDPFSSLLTISSEGEYEVTAVVHLVGRIETISSSQTVFVGAPLTSVELVESIRSDDLDRVEELGTTEYERRVDTFSISDSFGEISGTIDSNRFAYFWCEGDVALTARVLDLLGGSNESVAGLMIRSSLYGQATEVSVLVDNVGTVRVRSRELRSGNTTNEVVAAAELDFTYLQIRKTSSSIVVSGSVDGAQWSVLATKEFNEGSRSFAGMALAAGQAGIEAIARFDNVTFEGTLSEYTSQDAAPAAPTPLSSSSVAKAD